MWNDPWQRYAAATAVIVFAVIATYRVLVPVPRATVAYGLVTGAATVLFLLIVHARGTAVYTRIREHRQPLSFRQALVTTLLTGVMVVLLIYISIALLTPLLYMFRQSTVLPQVFFEIVQLIRMIESFHPLVFATSYVLTATLLIITVYTVYPLLPVYRRYRAAVLAFLLSWAFLLGGAYLVVPVIHPMTAVRIAIDTVLVTVWGSLFHYMYDKPLFSKPVRDRLYR